MSKLKKINISEVEGWTDSIFPAGTLWLDLQNKLRISDGVTQGGQLLPPNTGNVSFTTNVISGSGYELGLSPGRDFTTSTQYFRVRAGDDPAHLHFDTTNNNIYDLYIGNDSRYFKLSKNGPAVIQAENTSTLDTFTWTFDDSGKLKLPTVGFANPEISAVTVQNVYQGVLITPDPGFDQGQGLKIYPTYAEMGHLHLTANTSTVDLFLGDDNRYVKLASNGSIELSGNTITLWGEGIFSNSAILLPNNVDSATTPLLIAHYTATGVLIQAGQGVDPPYGWQFFGSGALKLPTNLTIDRIGNYVPVNGTVMLQDGGEVLMVVSSGTSGQTQIGWSEFVFDAGKLASITFNEGDTGDILIRTGSYTGTVYTWMFDNTGTVTFPDGAIITQSGFYAGSGTNAVLGQADGNTQIYTMQTGVGIQSYNSGTFITWLFDNNGSLTFPDSTTQTTAWAGGRVVNPPTTSLGQAGDRAGDIAFDDNYFYYCKHDYGSYPTETFTTVNAGEFNNAIVVNMAANPNYTVPQAGWTITLGQLMTLTMFSAPALNGVDYNFLFDNTSLITIPSTVTFTSNVAYTNIWKRISWSGDTW